MGLYECNQVNWYAWRWLGNHFCEIQQGSDGYIWIMIHSGSRNLGMQVCDYYHNQAKEQNTKWCSAVPTKWDLAFLPISEELAQDYIQEMQYCMVFAEVNRQMILEAVLECVLCAVGGPFSVTQGINIAHNYAALENHFGCNVWVHRKGATSAREGEYGVIPGSQGSKSYITLGKGNTDSFNSSPHGAGRCMGRKEAIRSLDLTEELRKLDATGVIHGMKNADDLDESPSAYKDIQTVTQNAQDLCEIVVELTPLCVIKGQK